jgi:hypothetical protein
VADAYTLLRKQGIEKPTQEQMAKVKTDFIEIQKTGLSPNDALKKLTVNKITTPPQIQQPTQPQKTESLSFTNTLGSLFGSTDKVAVVAPVPAKVQVPVQAPPKPPKPVQTNQPSDAQKATLKKLAEEAAAKAAEKAAKKVEMKATQSEQEVKPANNSVVGGVSRRKTKKSKRSNGKTKKSKALRKIRIRK